MKNKNILPFQHPKAVNWLLGSGLFLTAVAMTACSSSPTPNYYTMSPKITAATKSTVQVIEVFTRRDSRPIGPSAFGAPR